MLHPAFDPIPFIWTFETAVDKLINVRKELQKKTENMEQSVRYAEKEFSSKMVQLNSNFEVCYWISTMIHSWVTYTHLGSQQAVLRHGKQDQRSRQDGNTDR